MCVPHGFHSKVILPCLIVLVNFRGYLKVLGDHSRPRNLTIHEIPMLVRPALYVRVPIISVPSTNSGNETTNFTSIIFAADCNELYPFYRGSQN